MLDPECSSAGGILDASDVGSRRQDADERGPVAPGNENQAQSWGGYEGDIWARYPEFFDSSTREHQAKLMEAAAITAEALVLDIGCGTGGSTIQAARTAHRGTAVGIDLSPRMIERARALAARQKVTNATFIHGDAQIHPFEPASLDVAISRTGTMFFADQIVAFTNIARALRSRGVWRWCRGRARSVTSGSSRSSMR